MELENMTREQMEAYGKPQTWITMGFYHGRTQTGVEVVNPKELKFWLEGVRIMGSRVTERWMYNEQGQPIIIVNYNLNQAAYLIYKDTAN